MIKKPQNKMVDYSKVENKTDSTCIVFDDLVEFTGELKNHKENGDYYEQIRKHDEAVFNHLTHNEPLPPTSKLDKAIKVKIEMAFKL